MTSREIGSGISRMSQRGRRTARSRSGSSYQREKKMSPGERRRLVQLVVCAAIFVSIVAARLLLPERMERLTTTVREALGQSMDVQEVFSAVGRAVAGEATVSDALGDVYQAVFGPGASEAVETAVRVEAGWPKVDPLERLRAVTQGSAEDLPNPAGSAVPSGESEESRTQREQVAQTETSRIDAVSLVYSNLPKNVCMEQQILGFSYASPVVGVLSSGFGYREHPIEGEEKFHYGVDLAVDEGTTINCFADGTVSAVGESSSLGKYVIVEHENGYSTLYAHCSKVTVSSGAAVSKGQKVAEAGHTGLATGPHCHFELHRDSNYLNPIYYVQVA